MRAAVITLTALVLASAVLLPAPSKASLGHPENTGRPVGDTPIPGAVVPFFPNIGITDGTSPYDWQVEPTMVVNRSGQIFVGWKETDGPEAAGIRVGASFSTDQGLTWARNILMNQSHPNQGCHNSDPWMALDPSERVHFAYLEYDCGSGLDVSNTTDGRDWGTVHYIGGHGGLVDKDSMAFDTAGRLYATWDEDNILALTWSDDDGNHWAPIQNPGNVGDAVLGAIVTTFGNSTVYLTWWDINTDNIMFESSTDRGQTWSEEVRVNDRDGSAQPVGAWQIPIPAMNVDRNSGAIYIAWPDTRNGNQNIFMANSTDGGATWGTNHRINDDGGSQDQWMVDLAIDSQGTLHAAWEDGRNGAWNIFYSKSADGGDTWAANIRVSSEDTPGSYNRPGDYFAIEAGPNDYIYVVWTDGRGPDFDIYYARNPGFPAATITVATDPSGLSVTVDGVARNAPVQFNWTIGSLHNISTTSTIPITSTSRHVWTSWSDGGAISHVIVADSDRTITAAFRRQFEGKVAPDPTGLTVLVDNASYTTATAFWWDEGSTHWLEAPSPQPASPDVQYVWVSWSDGGDRAHVVSASAPIIATATFLQEQTMRVSTSPEGLSFAIDGASYSGATTFWFQPGSYHTVSAPIQQPGATGVRYPFVAWSDGGAATHVVVFSGAMSLEASFGTEYYLTVTPAVPGEGGSGWYPAGSTATATVADAVHTEGPGERLSFRGWGGDASGDGFTSNPILMDGPKIATALWQRQYYLTVRTAYGTATGEGWYDEGTSAVVHLASGIVPVSAGTRAAFVAWTGDAAGADPTGSSPILMSSPRTATAIWQTEYLVRVESDFGGVEGGGWYASGTTATLRASAQTTSGGQTYAFAGWTGDVSSSEAVLTLTVDHPIMVRATWTSAGFAGVLSTVVALLVVLLAVALLAVVVLWRRRRGRR